MLARHHDMRPAGQGFGKGLELLAPHHHGLAHGGRLEPGKIGRNAPGNGLVGANDIVAGNGRDEGDCGHGEGLAGNAKESKGEGGGGGGGRRTGDW